MAFCSCGSGSTDDPDVSLFINLLASGDSDNDNGLIRKREIQLYKGCIL